MKNHSILVIDDEESIRDSCSQALARNPDYSVATTSDAQSGLEMVRKTKPDMVLVDLKLPGMSGIEIIQEIKQTDPSIGSVIITAYPTIAAAVDAMKKGAYDFLPKPFTPDELRYIVKRALETRRVNLESQVLLKGQEATQRYFISMVAHELRSPLLSVQQYVEAILAGAAGEVLPQQEKIFHRMSSRIEGLTSLIDNWLSLNRLKTGKLGGDMKPVQMRPIINEVVEILRPCAHAKGVEITTDIPQDPAVVGNAECLKEMPLNLVGNALKYNREKGAITIRATPSSEKELSVSVQDTGCGIPEGDLPRIFDEFFQGENAENAENGGSGLGLSIVKQVVELHSGRIKVSSKLGQGSIFTVVLPLEVPLPERKYETIKFHPGVEAMPVPIDPSLISEVRKYGHFDVKACYACGSCAAVCKLNQDSALFPRKSMRYTQIGLRGPLLRSLDPWLCYYCGDCSTTCPRQAEPGESMMTLRRYLTAQYDWTGLSARMYQSHAWEFGALFAVGAFVAWIISQMSVGMPTDLTADGGVRINAFLPMLRVHVFDWVLAAVLSFFLLSNVARMWWRTMLKGPNPAPIKSYIEELWALIWNGATQIRFRECGNNDARWLKHLLLVSGYGLMFTMVVIFLPWFQVEDIYPLYHPQRWLGYYATAVLVIFTLEILWGRVKKTEHIHKFSELSDWIFPILLLLTAVTGILTHAFRYMGWPLPTYYMYAVHLIIAVPMLVVEVPFGKWAHLMYRPLGFYFQAVKDNAARRQQPAKGGPEPVERQALPA